LIVDGFGDGCFVGYFDEVCPKFDRKRGWDGYWFKTVVELPVLDDDVGHHGLLVKALSRIERKCNRVQYVGSDYEDGLSLLMDDEAVEVLPVKGRRYVISEVFVSSSEVHRQCAGHFAP
jgi:hypothetical protein